MADENLIVLETIDKAERQYNKLKISYEKSNQTEIGDDLSSLLVTIKSIPDHLLQDLNEKFGLNISLDDRYFKQKFKMANSCTH